MFRGVQQRATKEEFMGALGLQCTNPSHEIVYKAIRDVTVEVYFILNGNACHLTDIARSRVQQAPYKWNHIRQESLRWAAGEIWIRGRRNAQAARFFDMGATPPGHECEPNWVCWWMLYSVFRSRDERNNRHRKKGDDPDGMPAGAMVGSGGGRQGTSVGSSSGSSYYDPVRNGTR